MILKKTKSSGARYVPYLTLTTLALVGTAGMKVRAAQPAKATAAVHSIYYADTTPDIAGFWRPDRAPGRPGGWLVDGKPLPGRDAEGTWLGIPYTPTYLALYAKRQADSLAGTPYGDPHFNCWPRGPVSDYVSGGGTMAITQTPGRVQQIFEEDTFLREYFTDGRSIPAIANPTDKDYAPRMTGYSIGHWEGKTLVTETRGIRKELTLGFLGPHSDALVVTQRLTRIDPTHLSVDLKVTDQKALAKPMEIHLRFVQDPKGEFADNYCAENNRNYTDKDGYVTTETSLKKPTTWDLPDD